MYSYLLPPPFGSASHLIGYVIYNESAAPARSTCLAKLGYFRKLFIDGVLRFQYGLECPFID
jgi:hypothetical protein